MKNRFWILVSGPLCLGIALSLLAITHFSLLAKVRDQQRQIDQLYTVMPSLITDVRSPNGHEGHYFEYLSGEYKMCFADYRTGDALLIRLDPDPIKRHEKELRYVYAWQVPKEVLNAWTPGEVRKLPK